MFFAVYAGPSMNPVLREPEVLEIVPYGDRPVRVGDVVWFLRPHADHAVVHRVAQVTPAGVSTFGDNNTREDAVLVQPQDIHGRVVAAWRGQTRRQIAGGLRGRWTRRWRRAGNGLSRWLHPLYDAVSRAGVVARWLPAPLRPRIVVFTRQGQDQFRLLLGRHVIGRYDDRRRRWQIRRPWRVCVDVRGLRP